jgi:hypothetical protein
MKTNRPTTSIDRQQHRKGMARLLAYGTAIGILCGLVSIRFARAEVIDNSLIVGRQMTELAHTAKNQSLKVRLNGQEVMFASQLSHDSPKAILDRYEALCHANAAQSPEQWKGIADNAPAGADGQRGREIGDTGGTIRGGSAEEGTVMCFVKSSTSKTTIGEALSTFQTTGELGAIGQLRYAYVRKTKKGATHVLAMWTMDKFNVREMLPEQGDAPGADFDELPRPEGSRRLFSMQIVGAPFGLNVYESTQDPVALATSYDQRLTRDGWFAIDIESKAKRDTPRLEGVTGRVYEKDGILMTVVSHVENKKTVTGFGIAGVPQREEARR